MATGNIFTYRMPAGIPGAVNRELHSTSEPNILDSSTPPTAYGDPVKMGSNGKIQAFTGSDAIGALYGFLERPFPTQQQSYGNQPFGGTAPPAGGSCSILKRGYMTVALQGSTVPAAGGPVFIRIAGTIPTGGKIGGLEAAADSTNTLAIPAANTYFRGAGDTAVSGVGNVEIAYNM